MMFRTRFIRHVVLWFFAIVGVISLIPFYSVVTIRNLDNQQLVYSFPISQSKSFYIRYIHSIHLTPVIEEYSVNSEMKIVLKSVQFQSYGVGMPSDLAPGETFKELNGTFVIENMNRILPYFDQRIGQVIADHTLLINGQEISLVNLNPPGTAVRFRAERESLFQRNGRRILYWIKKINP